MIRHLAIAALLLVGTFALAADEPPQPSPEIDRLDLPPARSIEDIAKGLGLELRPGAEPNRAGSYRPKEIPDRIEPDPAEENRG